MRKCERDGVRVFEGAGFMRSILLLGNTKKYHQTTINFQHCVGIDATKHQANFFALECRGLVDHDLRCHLQPIGDIRSKTDRSNGASTMVLDNSNTVTVG